jgi:hypothetical protein
LKASRNFSPVRFSFLRKQMHRMKQSPPLAVKAGSAGSAEGKP